MENPNIPPVAKPVPHETISWDTEEYIQHPKSALWYAVFTIVSIALLAYAVYSKSILTMVLFGLIVLLGFIFSHKSPRVVKHQLTPSGIVLGDAVYPYKNIKTFWIIYQPPSVKTLNLETTAYLNPEVTIQLGHQDPVAVKAYLTKFLPEDLEREESFADVISRRLKF